MREASKEECWKVFCEMDELRISNMSLKLHIIDCDGICRSQVILNNQMGEQ